MPRVYPPIEGRQTNPAISPTLIESAAGFSAGVISTLVVHPFDVVKTRLQIEQGKASRPGDTIRVIRQIATEAAAGLAQSKQTRNGNLVGTAKSFYRGLMPNMVGNSVSWALYFVWYSNLKEVMQNIRGKDIPLKSADYFMASGSAGVITAILTNPIWVIKTRMLSTAKYAPGAYRSISHGAHELYQSEGLRGFYRGLLPSLFGVSHGAVQFMAYEKLKIRWATLRGGKDNITNFDYLYLSAGSKIFAGSITYPYQVVRARLQTYDAQFKYKGALDVIRKVYHQQGLLGFYKGVVPNIVRVLPSTCVTFLVYENTKFYLPRFYGSVEEDTPVL